MQVLLPYGRGEMNVSVPDSCAVRRSERRPPLSNPPGALRKSLDWPVQSPRLEELSQGSARACIVVSDNTRAVPTQLLLPEIIRRIRTRTDRIEILVATGMHPPLAPHEVVDLIGEDIASSYDVTSHDPRSPDHLLEIGVARTADMPVWINKTYASSDLRILTGLVEPHFMAGFSGGRKSICPGICGLPTIASFHGPALLESPFAAPGVLDGNPVHEAASEVAAMVPADFIVNATVDGSLRPSGFYAGDMVGAWEAAVRAVEAESHVPVEKQYDIVVTTNGGHPLDRNFYQTVKGLVSAAACLRAGGQIVMLSACTDGLGTPAFRRCLEDLWDAPSLDDYIRMLSEPGRFMEEQWEVEEYIKARRRASRILVCATGLNRDDAQLAGVELFAEPAEALQSALGHGASNCGMLVLPEGPYSIPVRGGEVLRVDHPE